MFQQTDSLFFFALKDEPIGHELAYCQEGTLVTVPLGYGLRLVNVPFVLAIRKFSWM